MNNKQIKAATKLGGEMAIDALLQAIESNIKRNGGESKLTLNEMINMIEIFKKHYMEVVQ